MLRTVLLRTLFPRCFSVGSPSSSGVPYTVEEDDSAFHDIEPIPTPTPTPPPSPQPSPPPSLSLPSREDGSESPPEPPAKGPVPAFLSPSLLLYYHEGTDMNIPYEDPPCDEGAYLEEVDCILGKGSTLLSDLFDDVFTRFLSNVPFRCYHDDVRDRTLAEMGITDDDLTTTKIKRRYRTIYDSTYCRLYRKEMLKENADMRQFQNELQLEILPACTGEILLAPDIQSLLQELSAEETEAMVITACALSFRMIIAHDYDTGEEVRFEEYIMKYRPSLKDLYHKYTTLLLSATGYRGCYRTMRHRRL